MPISLLEKTDGKKSSGHYVVLIVYKGGSDLGTPCCASHRQCFSDVEQSSACAGTTRQAEAAGLAFHTTQGGVK